MQTDRPPDMKLISTTLQLSVVNMPKAFFKNDTQTLWAKLVMKVSY